MTLTIGTQLGSHEITGLLGKGGMGEVYRARDLKLKREVAIKILPGEFAQDSDRVSRFQREAEVLASLNHPNIAGIHDLQEANGSRFLVLELVEGEALSNRIARGPIPLDEALGIAKQVADALEAAHETGIVHRDLKPGNIVIRPDGSVKVLDFGLAKVVAAGRSTPVTENSPTISMAATQAGVVLGTAAYMSPEQARGKNVTPRSDIWAFGVVLYEMLTAKRLFEGEDLTETLASVVKEQPDLSAASFEVQRLLQACLQKDPRKRLRAIGDWKFLLDEPRPVTVLPSTRPSRSIPWSVAAVLALALGLALWAPWRKPPEIPLRTTFLPPPEGQIYDFQTSIAVPAVSPDGKRVVFGAKGADGKSPLQLWMRLLDSPTAQPLPGTERGTMPFWSPDSRWIGFASQVDRKLRKIDIQGGPPVSIADLPADLRGASWSADGMIVLGLASGSPIMRVSSAGGLLSPATKLQGKDSDHRFPWFLPDGKHFLFIVPPTKSTANELRVASLNRPDDSGKAVGEAESTVLYALGHLLFLRGSTLMAQPFDAGALQTTGEAKPIAENIPTYMNPSRVAGFTVSQEGLLLYHPTFNGNGRTQLTWLNRDGKPIATVGEPVEDVTDIELSPDNKSLIGLIAAGVSGGRDLWIWDLIRGGLKQRFTFEGDNRFPIWSPDGSSIIWRSSKVEKVSLMRRPSNASAPPQEVFSVPAPGVYTATSWAPNQKSLLITAGGNNSKTRSDILVLPLDGSGPAQPRPFLQTDVNEGRAIFSPDGKWLAYISDQSGQTEVYVLPYPGPGGKRQISSGGASFIRWRRDGRELFYMNPVGQLIGVEVSTRNGSFEVGQAKRLLGDIALGPRGGRGPMFDVSTDGQKIIVPLIIDTSSGQSVPPLTLVENWPGLIKK
jgi:serine/threonine protein kinase/WD40 repeat protein